MRHANQLARAKMGALAAEAAGYLVWCRRVDGSVYVARLGNAPEWVDKIVEAAHGGRPHDDKLHQLILSALTYIRDFADDLDEVADLFVRHRQFAIQYAASPERAREWGPREHREVFDVVAQHVLDAAQYVIDHRSSGDTESAR